MTASRATRLALLTLGPALAAALLVAPGASADLLSPESGGSPNADAIDTLYWLVMGLAVIVFAGVEGLLIYSLWKFRSRKGRVAAQIHGNTQLEIGWTVGAAVLLIFITAVTFIKLPDIRNPEQSDARAGLAVPVVDDVEGDRDQPDPPDGRSLNIKVHGLQYVWRFQYPELAKIEKGANVFSYEELVVPANTTVTLDVTSEDVAHSWWIPKLGGKVDAIPSYVNKTWFKAPEAGAVYDGQCAELCGRNHSDMRARVRVVSPAEFRRWYSAQWAAIKQARQEGAETRTQMQEELSGR